MIKPIWVKGSISRRKASSKLRFDREMWSMWQKWDQFDRYQRIEKIQSINPRIFLASNILFISLVFSFLPCRWSNDWSSIIFIFICTGWSWCRSLSRAIWLILSSHCWNIWEYPVIHCFLPKCITKIINVSLFGFTLFDGSLSSLFRSTRSVFNHWIWWSVLITNDQSHYVPFTYVHYILVSTFILLDFIFYFGGSCHSNELHSICKEVLYTSISRIYRWNYHYRCCCFEFPWITFPSSAKYWSSGSTGIKSGRANDTFSISIERELCPVEFDGYAWDKLQS